MDNFNNKTVTLGNLATYDGLIRQWVDGRVMTSEDTDSMMQRVLGAND